MRLSPYLLAMLLMVAMPATARPIAAVIDEYVRQGLASNLGLQGATLEVERNAALLDADRARLIAEAGLEARYTKADGGRTIEIPNTGIEVPLLRPREQETALVLTQPVYVPALPAAVRAQRATLESSRHAREAVARRLQRDITVGYLRWQQAAAAAQILAESRELLGENLRVNQALFAAGSITEDQVLRARAEQLAVDQQLREARNSTTQAQSALNHLLNRPLDTVLEAGELDAELRRTREQLATLRAQAIAERPERAQSASGVRAAQAAVELSQAARKPSVVFAAEGGAQGERYEFGRGRNYATLSLLLNWNLFDGGRRRSEGFAARARVRQLQLQDQELERQIELEVRQSLDALNATDDWMASAEARVAAAQAGFRIASRKRDAGAISQVEFIDARNALTSAELNLNLTRYELLARQAQLDYATAAGELPLPDRDATP